MTGVPLGNIFTTSIFKKKKKRARLGYYQKLERNYPFEMNRTFLSFYTNQLIIDGNENPWNQRITQTYRDRWHKGQIIIFLDRECWKIFTCKHFVLSAYNLFQCLQPLQTIYFKIFHPPHPPPLPSFPQKNNGPSLSGTDQYWDMTYVLYQFAIVNRRH